MSQSEMVKSTSIQNDSIQMELDVLVESCRVCLTRSKAMCSIFDSKQPLSEQIEYCTNIQVKQNDRLPLRICKLCLKNLSIAYKFKTTCIQSDSIIRNFIKPVKIEKREKEEPSDEPYIDNMADITNDSAFDNDTIETVDSKEDKTDMLNVKEDILNELSVTKLASRNEHKLKKNKVRKKRSKEIDKIKSKVPCKTLNSVSMQEVSLSCIKCSLVFENSEQSIAHRKERHKCKQWWICEICGKQFLFKSSLNSHVLSHLPPQYTCDKCDYSTSYKHDLSKHMRTHNGIKEYQCEFCTATYHTSSNLLTHIRAVHEKERRHACTICDKKFFDKTKLNRHLDSHNEIKRFECEVCHSCFTRRCYWKSHLLRQHNIETPKQRPGPRKGNLVMGQ